MAPRTEQKKKITKKTNTTNNTQGTCSTKHKTHNVPNGGGLHKRRQSRMRFILVKIIDLLTEQGCMRSYIY